MKCHPVGAAALVAALLFGAVPAQADNEATIGKIDMMKVFQESKLYQQLSADLKAFGDKLVARSELRSRRYSLLLDEEWNRLVELLEKGPRLTAPERATIQEMQKLNNDRDVELAQLEGLAEHNEEQKARYKELTAKRTQARQGQQDLQARVEQQINERRTEVIAQFNGELEKAVEKVAGEKGLTTVVQSGVVLYGGLDITDEVIETLNAAAPEGDDNG